MKKRLGLLSTLIAICLLAMLIPGALAGDDGSAAKIGDNCFQTLEGAFDAANGRDTDDLLSDCETSGHEYGKAEYIWDGLECTARRVCTKCAVGTKGRVESETEEGVYVKDADANCNESEKGHYEAEFYNDAFEKACTPTGSVSVGDPLGHKYGSAEYKWSGDQCTASLVCSVCAEGTEGHIFSETVTGKYIKDTAASCLESEKGHYEAEFTSEAFEKNITEANSVSVGDPLGHKYGQVDYKSDGEQCTASRSCSVCAEGTEGHIETETVTRQYVADTAASCLESEKGHYEVVFSNEAFEKIVTEANSVSVGEAAGHKYGDVQYKWDGDECTATRVCSACAKGTEGHIETETEKGVFVKDTDASCLESAKGHYEAEFNNEAFEKACTEANSVSVGEAVGHKYGAVQYKWDKDQCTAFRVCSACAEGTEGHIDGETVTGRYIKDTEASCLESEKGHYEAEFTNKIFDKACTEESSVSVGEAVGHKYGDVQYKWNGDQCTATHACSVCAAGTEGHVESETVTGKYVKDTNATCLEPETGHYEAVFDNTTLGKSSTIANSVINGNSTGHKYGAAVYKWNGIDCTAVRECTECAEGTKGHSETETATGSYVMDEEASCLAPEKGHYEASFNNEAFGKSSTEKSSVAVGSSVGHKYGGAEYSWSGDKCTAVRVCVNCTEGVAGHSDSETVTGKYVKDTDASCLEPEKGHYEAEFNNQAFEKKSTDANSVVSGSPAGHKYGKPEYSWESNICTAVRVCSVCADGVEGHSETVTAAGVYVKDTDASCIVCEKGHYEADFKSDIYGKCSSDKNSVDNGEPLDHDYIHHDGKEPTCTSTGWKAYDTCSRCDFTSFEMLAMLDHVYTDPVFNWNGHECKATFTCVCKATIDVVCLVTPDVIKAPTCTVDGETMYTAVAVYNNAEYSIFKIESVPATGHKYETPQFNWTDFRCSGIMVCSCGDSIPVTCSLVNSVTRNPSCSAAGERTYTATITFNGKSYTDTKISQIERLPHTEGGVTVENQVPPTCTEEGSYDEVKYCTKCGQQISRVKKSTPPNDHEYVHHEAKAPTCTDIGWFEYDSCKNCDWDNRVIIPENNHKWLDVVTPPTCIERGYTTRTCRVCREVVKTDYTDELGHDFSEPEFEWAPDYSSAVAKVNCTRCGINTFACTIKANVAIEPTCTQKGSRTYVASVIINDELASDIQSEVIDATGHTFSKEVIAPTCERGGYTIYTCQNCTATKTSDYVKATGHQYENIVTKPTCLEQGYTTHTCVCGVTYTDSYTDALGHSYKNGVCTRCGEGTPTVVAPKVTGSNNASTGKPHLSWAKATGASKYEIWRATSKSGTYSKMYTTTNLSYNNTSANAGYTYYYKVRSVTADGEYSSYSNVVERTCDCAQPVVTAGNNSSTGKCTLKWSAVTGASKYEIWRATSSSGTYTKMYTTSSTSYTNTSSKAGYTYYYKVKALSSRTTYADSAYSAAVSRTCDCPVVTPKITLSSGHPKLTWSSVEGASKYEIWRATSSNGTYTKMYTTSSTSYTNTSSKAGTTYYYKIVSISSRSTYANSAYSTPVSIKAK